MSDGEIAGVAGVVFIGQMERDDAEMLATCEEAASVAFARKGEVRPQALMLLRKHPRTNQYVDMPMLISVKAVFGTEGFDEDARTIYALAQRDIARRFEAIAVINSLEAWTIRRPDQKEVERLIAAGIRSAPGAREVVRLMGEFAAAPSLGSEAEICRVDGARSELGEWQRERVEVENESWISGILPLSAHGPVASA